MWGGKAQVNKLSDTQKSGGDNPACLGKDKRRSEGTQNIMGGAQKLQEVNLVIMGISKKVTKRGSRNWAKKAAVGLCAGGRNRAHGC